MVVIHRCQEVALFAADIRESVLLEWLGMGGDLTSRFKSHVLAAQSTAVTISERQKFY